MVPGKVVLVVGLLGCDARELADGLGLGADGGLSGSCDFRYCKTGVRSAGKLCMSEGG